MSEHGKQRRPLSPVPESFRHTTRTVAGQAPMGHDDQWLSLCDRGVGAINGAMWRELDANWTSGHCSELEHAAQDLEEMTESTRGGLSEIAEEFAEWFGIEEWLAIPLGWMVGSLLPIPFANELRIAAAVIRVFNVSLCAELNHDLHDCASLPGLAELTTRELLVEELERLLGIDEVEPDPSRLPAKRLIEHPSPGVEDPYPGTAHTPARHPDPVVAQPAQPPAEPAPAAPVFRDLILGPRVEMEPAHVDPEAPRLVEPEPPRLVEPGAPDEPWRRRFDIDFP